MNKGLDAYKIKLIALAFMILDHVSTYLSFVTVDYQPWPRWPQFIGIITRFVSPLFLYLMIEGFYHTRSRKKYITRLFAAGVIMMAGNITINYLFHSVDSYTGKYTLHSLIQGHDIFLTLAFMFGLVWCLENLKAHKNILLNVILMIVCALCGICMEGGIVLLPMTLIIWFLREKKSTMCLVILAFCLLLLLKALVGYDPNSVDSFYAYMCYEDQWAMAAVIPFILLYNGERGKNTPFTKYMFYVIYPLHLWVLMIAYYLILSTGNFLG